MTLSAYIEVGKSSEYFTLHVCTLCDLNLPYNVLIEGGKLPATCLYYQRFKYSNTLKRHQNFYLQV